MARGMSTGGTMTGGKLAKLSLGFPLLLLAFAGWAIALAGVSIVDHFQGGSNTDPLEFAWWVIFFDLFVLLCVAIYFVELGAGFGISQGSVLALLAVVEVLKMLQTDNWNQARKAAGDNNHDNGSNNKYLNGVRTAFAGFLVASVAEALLIIVIGHHTNQRHNVNTSKHHMPSSGTTATANPLGTSAGGVGGNSVV